MQTKCIYSQFLQGKKNKTWLLSKICFFWKKIECLTLFKSLIQNSTCCGSFSFRNQNFWKNFLLRVWYAEKLNFQKLLYGSFFGKLPSESFLLKMRTRSRNCQFYRRKWIKTWFCFLHKNFQDQIFSEKNQFKVWDVLKTFIQNLTGLKFGYRIWHAVIVSF